MNISTFVILAVVHAAVLVAWAQVIPVGDCDETMNFAEPSHLLLFGHGLQTWEYSPQFALRSWLFLWWFSWPGLAVKWLFNAPPVAVYFAVRVTTALVSAAANLLLVRQIDSIFGNAWLTFPLMTFLSLSTGYAQASASFLPTTFAMQFFTVALAGWMSLLFSHGRPLSVLRAMGVVFPVAAAALVGWPFAALIALPMAVYFLTSWRKFLTALCASAIALPLIVGPSLALDMYYYCRATLVAWNIVTYNMLGGEERGPHLYGVEPWTFFFKNLFLNFNVAFVAALAFPIVVLGDRILSGRRTSSEKLLLAGAGPFFVWFLFWLTVPHKEERFMVPVYPFLALCAAGTLSTLAGTAASRRHKTFRRVACVTLLVTFSALSLSRTAALVHFYAAPQQVLLDSRIVTALEQPQGKGQEQYTMCLGKEWYRFPTHFFLPRNWRVRFVKTPHFSGALPQLFPTAAMGDSRSATCAINPTMNDLNREVKAQYVEVSQCDALYDSFSAVGDPVGEEEVLHRHFPHSVATRPYQLLDAGSTPSWCRLLFVPYVTSRCGSWKTMDVRFRNAPGQSDGSVGEAVEDL